MKTIAIAGTFDTKGPEFLYIKELIEGLGLNTFTIHTGVYESSFNPDVPNSEVAKAAGTNIEKLAAKKDRAIPMELLSKGMEKLIPQLYSEGKFDGIISLGGSGGTSLVTPAMRALPIGVPKIMVSTVASGNTAPYIGTSDIIMMPSIVDVSGLNSISTKIFANAVFAMAGMVKFENTKKTEKKPLIATTMFGVTTPCVNAARKYLEAKGYEVLVFHATGAGGRCMESLINHGFIQGVLDLTTTEWADEVIGGVLSAGENRLEAAAKNNIPQVVSVGALDMCNFGPYDTVPEKFKKRRLYKHNPTVTLMRTNGEENKQIAEKIAQKLNMSKGKTVLMLPLKGVSSIDTKDQPFYGEKEDKILFTTLKDKVDKSVVEVIDLNFAINDSEFAEIAAQRLIDLINM
ncbi:Tm-1-like ATP-binding domain-containing protein [Clostridium oceanicum]|uniref:Tm-1-like ATP-binding domain-containing protein n=1 Tax=Clostridium oceanicum TaxID=1543 RepID=A0ABP3UH81_9CLOT